MQEVGVQKNLGHFLMLNAEFNNLGENNDNDENICWTWWKCEFGEKLSLCATWIWTEHTKIIQKFRPEGQL